MDIGCGFGRQAILLAKEGYVVTGTDTSGTFISIANKLFKKFGYQGEFIQTDLLDDDIIKDKFSQIIILDVLEHIPPTLRKIFITKIYDRSTPALILIISLPKVKDRLTSRFNNRIRKTITQHIKYFFSKEEHPYPIPERNDLIKLMIEKFSLLRLETTKDTDFYVYQRK